jgi:hypothetical protein
MNLYMVHVGFYDHSIGEGIYESHINYFIAAVDPKDAKRKVLSLEEFQNRSMHIDGIKEISKVDGYEVKLIESSEVKDGKVFSYDESSNL